MSMRAMPSLRAMAVAAILIATAAPALAFQCPSDIAKIDAALAANPGLETNTRNTVKTLRDTGERLHNAGRHQDAVKTLAGAKQILTQLGINLD